MLDKIDPEIIPAKYDFWWGEIKSRQCIEAANMSEDEVAEEIYKECCMAGIFNQDARTGEGASATALRQSSSGPASASQKNGSHTAAAPQQDGKKPMSAALIAVPVILIAVIGLFAFRALSGGSNANNTKAANAANTVAETEAKGEAEPDSAKAGVTVTASDTSAETDTSAGTQATPDTDAPSTDTSAENDAAPQEEAGADTVLPESEAEEEVQEDPYKDVILPKSLPDEFYVEKDHTYAFYDASRYGFTTYKEVADFCRQQGGHLAVINNAAENNYLFRLLRDVSEITAFFGYSDEDGEGDWQWSDGDSSYTNWTTYGDWHLPDNGEEWGGDEDYAEFNYERGKPGIPSDGTWNDATFMENTPYFICEWEFDVKKAQEARSSQ